MQVLASNAQCTNNKRELDFLLYKMEAWAKAGHFFSRGFPSLTAFHMQRSRGWTEDGSAEVTKDGKQPHLRRTTDCLLALPLGSSVWQVLCGHHHGHVSVSCHGRGGVVSTAVPA